MYCGPSGSPLCIQHCIQLIPSQSTFPFLKYGYRKFDLENPRSRSLVRSKFKVTTWVQHPIDSHPFMSIQPPMTRSFHVFFDLSLNKRLRKQLWGWWFETPPCPFWRHCNVYPDTHKLAVVPLWYSTLPKWVVMIVKRVARRGSNCRYFHIYGIGYTWLWYNEIWLKKGLKVNV